MANGFPIACLAGKRYLMEPIADLQVNHSGTYNSNVMVTAAAYATICELERLDYQRIHRLGEALMNGLNELAAKSGISVLVQGFGPVFHLAFTERDSIVDYRDSLAIDKQRNSEFCGRNAGQRHSFAFARALVPLGCSYRGRYTTDA